MQREDARSTVLGLLKQMTERKASDLFLTVGFPPAMKIDGKVTRIGDQVLDDVQTRALAAALMNERQAAEYEATKECNFAVCAPEVGRFRASALVQQGCAALVLRTIPAQVPTFETLQLPPVLRDLAMTKRGLIIFVGATGSGKTTSMAALLNHRNEHDRGHIITLEDPIEFVHQHKECIVTQREIGVDSVDWDIALKNTLRQAPDVIMMGEIRDRTTMDYAMAFAETGHLCLATLHANSANQAIDRIINFFPQERHQQLFMDLSLNLKAMISQRLIPKKGGAGRVAAVEIMIGSPLIQDLIFKGDVKEIKEVMKRSREAGMQTFDQHLFDLLEAGLIAEEDALRHADSVNDLRLNIKLNGAAAKNSNPLEKAGNLNLLK